jgi:hypothetical protein
LADALRAEGGLLADAVRQTTEFPPAEAGEAAIGPRTQDRPDEYALLVEAIREGYLQHYGTARVVDAGADDDLALLAGDRLYAFGLARLSELGDLEGIEILARIISGCAQVHAEGRPEEAASVWADGLAALSGRRD